MRLVVMMMVVVTGAVVGLGRAVPVEDDQVLTRVTRQQPLYGITHLDIRNSIQDVTSKLVRHEAREAQVADFITKTLNSLTSDHSLQEKNVQAVARQLALMEERLLSLEALVTTTDERQRMMMNQITQGLDRLLSLSPGLEEFPGTTLAPTPKRGPPSASDSTVIKILKKINRKVTTVDETLNQQMDQLQERQEQLNAKMQNCETDLVTSIQSLGDTMTASTERIQEQMEQQECTAGGEAVNSRLDSLDQLIRDQEEELHDLSQQTNKNLEDHLTTLQMLLEESHSSQALISSSVANLTSNLRLLDNTTQARLGNLRSDMTATVKESAATVKDTMSSVGNDIKVDTGNIIDILDDTASQAETLQNTVIENYSELSAEINGLKRVEQVMINTADSVLDTKRSIEFGIQQIILELGEIVKNSGSTINNTLSDQISNISFAILKNQTSALTNMTAKMEQEISQVWRQIGIMYQQMTQSVDLLGQLKDTTKQHMNVSLARVGDMDGTVGKINTKVADVEDNLNYLLGRLSLVVSEFNLMKTGVGQELTKLRDNLAKENNNPVHFEGAQPASEDRYEVGKRHAIHSDAYPGYNPKPLTVF